MNHTLDELDPLPEFAKGLVWSSDSFFSLLPESERQKKAWRDACEKADGEDWRPYTRRPDDTETPYRIVDGKKVYELWTNGAGRLETRSPEPVDVPIPCVRPVYPENFLRLMKLAGCSQADVQTCATAIAFLQAGCSDVKFEQQGGCWVEVAEFTPQPELPEYEEETEARSSGAEASGSDEKEKWNPPREESEWIPHKPGDPCPVKPGTRIYWKDPSGNEWLDGWTANDWAGNWGCITAWKPA